jgi:hypothetical protein
MPGSIRDNVHSLEKNMKTNWLSKLFYRITGGRPMTRECSIFFDSVAGKQVFYFRDRLRNVRYMATHKWAKFRVKANIQS